MKLITFISALVAAPLASSSSSFNWSSITPTSDLRYHDCYDEYKCARLKLPLDWLNETDSRTVAIAITKLPAIVSDDDASFGGSVFFNPGGPGNSGVEYTLSRAHQLRNMIDKNHHYEIVSFDPRGVGYSTPQSRCFQSDVSRDVLTLQSRGTGGLTQGSNSLRQNHALRASYARICEQSDEAYGEIMGYAGTASVARDMVAMVDSIEELRGGQTEQCKRTEKSAARLQYIGLSYGTVLGNYFASMFPGRVGRMALDGVINAYDYATGGWTTSLVDADKIYDEFYRGCFKAGSLICPLTNANDTRPRDIRTRVESFIAGLDQSPLALSYQGAPFVLTGDDVRTLIGSTLYDPVAGFPSLAYGLAQAIAGDPTLLVSAIVSTGSFPSVSEDCAADLENQVASPGEDVTSMDIPWWQSYVKLQESISRILAPAWSSIRFACSSWRFRANWRFSGPFSTPRADPAGVQDVPVAPLLFMSNHLDPVTPLRSARAMAAGHPGAGLVVQNAMGHTVLLMDPGECVEGILAEYFESGTVPKEAHCEPTCTSWDVGCRSNSTNTKRSEGLSSAGGGLRLTRSPLGLPKWL